ncbi:MAG: hypothetical protein FJ044_00740 [Candidatus Cloacimonetes bacterium]|nr:hypothetical protein [Candidatus Cloacimonadota bacterium]
MPKSPEEIVKNLVASFRAGKGVFKERINVEDWVPTWPNREEKAKFLFLVTVLDYGMKSVVLYKGANNLFRERRELLQPKNLIRVEEKVLSGILQKFLHVRFPNEAAKRWTENSRQLLTTYNGDVLSLFNEPSALKVLTNIHGFRGFGEKTGNLFFRSVVNTFGINYVDIDEVPMPIDRHKLRLTYEWGFINAQQYQEGDREKVSRIWKMACQRVGISWLEFDRAFWIWGVHTRESLP